MECADSNFVCRVAGHLDQWSYDHDHPELNSWYESLHSGKGPCCDMTFGTHIWGGAGARPCRRMISSMMTSRDRRGLVSEWLSRSVRRKSKSRTREHFDHGRNATNRGAVRDSQAHVQARV